MTALSSALQSALTLALKGRDREAAAAYRGALSAIDADRARTYRRQAALLTAVLGGQPAPPVLGDEPAPPMPP